jgi:hypothetical protein
VEFELALDGTTVVAFPGLYASPWAYPGLIKAAITGVPGRQAVEVRLPRPLPGRCQDSEDYYPTLSRAAKVSRPLTVVMPDAGPEERHRASLCTNEESEPVDLTAGVPTKEDTTSKDAPMLVVSGMTFEGPVQFLFPEGSPVGLALTANKFASAVAIDTAGQGIVPRYAERPVAPGAGLPRPRLAVNSSVFEADSFIGKTHFRSLDVYFNKMHSFTLDEAILSEELVVRDNDTGPLRFRRLGVPPKFRVDANRVRDSLYLTETLLPASDAAPSFLHNQVDGNLVINVRAPAGGSPRRLRIANTSVGGSAYVSFGDRLLGPAADPTCNQKEGPLGPADVQFIDTRVASRLVLSVARGAEQYPGSNFCLLTPTNPTMLSGPARCSSAAGGDGREVKFDLTGTSTRVFAWNLPNCSARGDTGFAWSGQNFNFERFEPLPLDGLALTPVVAGREPDEVAAIGTWAGRHDGDDSGVYARLEAYTLANGNVFDSWHMKGEKVLAILASQGSRHWHGIKARLYDAYAGYAQSWRDVGAWTLAALPWAGTAAVAATASGTADPAVARPDGEQRTPSLPCRLWAVVAGFAEVWLSVLYTVFDGVKLLLVGTVYVWGFPAVYGQHPQLALFLLVLSVFGFAKLYEHHSVRCAGPSDRWREVAHEMAAATRGSDDSSTADFWQRLAARPHEQPVTWADLAGRDYLDGSFSTKPGFLLRDKSAWRLSFFKYSIDCTIPLVDMDYRRAYKPFNDDTWRGTLVIHLPTLQLIIGLWFGTWAVAIFFV